jgi:copper chaperone NosL
MLKHKFLYIVLLIFVSLLIIPSCGSEPEPINYGTDECEFCRMLITDNRYGAEIVTDKGKIYKFDSIECMIEFALVKNMIGDKNQKLLVTDFATPESFTDATTAFYVHNDDFRSPMGLNVSAFDSEISRQKFVAEGGGNLLNWIDVIELVKQSGMHY